MSDRAPISDAVRLDGRPNPDALLAKVAADESGHARGRLKIFFGYSAGVGKTYAMLEAARALEMKRGDVLAGYVEPHGRPETEALLLGLDILPFKRVEYRGIVLREFDLDAALAQRPKLILVDELAHTNADGCRHAKRWQDVVELLDAGIDVYTTLNVQHVESLNDIVGKITGIVVRETVPDSVFDMASEVELVDLPPGELLERFGEGKVYMPEQARRAADKFFRKETLVALRELALRKTAEHVNRQVELGRRGLPTRPIWATRERLMVAVGPSPTSARLIRAARRMATELRAPWYAVAVERPSAGTMSSATRSHLDANLRLAESLGAETVTLQRENIADALVDFAQDRGITRLVVGKTAEPRWKRMLGSSVVDRIIRRSGDLDVLVIRGDVEARAAAPEADEERVIPTTGEEFFTKMLMVSPALVLSIVAGLGLRWLGVAEPNIIMVFLLAVVVIAYTGGRVASAVLAVLSVLAFNYFFTEPRYTLAVENLEYVLTFGVMLTVGLVVSGLVGRVRAQADAAGQRADANEVLYRVSRQLATTTGLHQVGVETVYLLDNLLRIDAVVFLRETGAGEKSDLGAGMGDSVLMSEPRERGVASWVLENGVEAGIGTGTLPHAAAWYLPLSPSEDETVGVLGVRSKQGTLDHGMRRLLHSIATIVAQAIEREQLAEQVKEASVEAEAERLRSDLLAAVSHDLRTPLSAIRGSASAVLHSHTASLADGDREMLEDISTESERLVRLVENLLQLGRLDEGHARPRADWHPVEELVDAALRQIARTGDAARVRSALPGEPVFCWADETIMTQVLVNLLDNALKYAPAGEVVVAAGKVSGGTLIEVSDSGPGFPPGDPSGLFERFARGDSDAVRAARGSGLGLAICRAAVVAHGGTIEASNKPGGGARVALTLPDPDMENAPGPRVGHA